MIGCTYHFTINHSLSLVEPEEDMGFEYIFKDTPATHADAKAVCNSINGELASVTSDEENGFLAHFVSMDYNCNEYT